MGRPDGRHPKDDAPDVPEDGLNVWTLAHGSGLDWPGYETTADARRLPDASRWACRSTAPGNRQPTTRSLCSNTYDVDVQNDKCHEKRRFRGRDALAERARALVDEDVIARERELAGETAISDATVRDLRAAAREYDVYAPQIPEEHGGMGYDFRDVLPAFEEAGRSLLGPRAMRVAAPDEGNMHTLELVGTEAQKEEYLQPLVAGEIRRALR